MHDTSVLLLAALSSFAIASPSPAPVPDPVAEAHPEITPFRVRNAPSRTVPIQKRDILSKLESDVTSVLASLGSGIPSYVASGEWKAFLEELNRVHVTDCAISQEFRTSSKTFPVGRPYKAHWGSTTPNSPPFQRKS